VKLTARQAARLLGVSETKIYRWVDDGEIPFTMVHHRPLFHRVELLEWAMSLELPLPVELREGGEPLLLTSALERGGGGTGGAGGTGEAGETGGTGGTIDVRLEELAEELPALSPPERELIRAVIAARSDQMLVVRAADRIAVPRASSPLICPGTPGLVLLRWAARRPFVVRDAPVDAVFLIAAPTIRRHHELLSRMSLALHDRAFRAAARQTGRFAEVVAEARRWEQELATGRAAGLAPGAAP